MRNWLPGLVIALAFGSGCDEEEKDPSPVGNSSGPGGGNGSSSGGDDDDDDGTGDDGTGGNPGDGGGAWAVGEGAEMLRIEADGAGSGYELDVETDLLAIACHGERVAWVVGDGGTLLYTHDGGDTWNRASLDTDATLRGVAISSSDAIFVVGDDGEAYASRDAGARFVAIPGANVDFTAVATDAAGAHAFATAFDGSIWRHDAGEVGLTQVYDGDAALFGVASTLAGERVVAVGEDGTWIESDDGGASWRAVDAGTVRDLFAVRVATTIDLALAVGDAGALVRRDALGWLVSEVLDEETALRAVHLAAGGHGITVGDAGVAFVTHDAGLSWEPIGVPTTRDLLGVDEISLHGHL